jgi:hypothetical protein
LLTPTSGWDRKVKIFYVALTIDMKLLLGDSPSQQVNQICMFYSQDLKGWLRWQLNQIALLVYILGKHVHELLKACAKRVAS